MGTRRGDAVSFEHACTHQARPDWRKAEPARLRERAGTAILAEATDRVMQTPGDPGSDLQVGMQAIQNAGDGEVLALFQSLSADKRKMALEILHLVIAISGPGNRRDPGGGTNLRQRVE